MIETVCDPYGKAAFPQVVKCDLCGERIIDNGWMPAVRTSAGLVIDDSIHWCDECGAKQTHRTEFRVCRRCYKPMFSGFTDEGNEMGYSFLCCEECFGKAFFEVYGSDPRAVDDDGCGGYYEWYDARECEWCGTGVYYTDWV